MIQQVKDLNVETVDQASNYVRAISVSVMIEGVKEI